MGVGRRIKTETHLLLSLRKRQMWFLLPSGFCLYIYKYIFLFTQVKLTVPKCIIIVILTLRFSNIFHLAAPPSLGVVQATVDV